MGAAGRLAAVAASYSLALLQALSRSAPSFIVHCSFCSFIVHHSSFGTQHSSLIARESLLITRYL